MMDRDELPPFSDLDTSYQASIEIRESARTLRGRVLDLLLRRGIYGATDEEIQDTLKMSANTERPRRRELEQAGAIVRSGIYRRTRSGRAAVVWQVR
jgi:DNA-binding Lrp family transcriptional regulator